MTALTARYVIDALRNDVHPNSGWVQRDGRPVEPRDIWLGAYCIWIRADGSYASGRPLPAARFTGTQFGFIERLRIRHAVRQWVKRLKPEAR